jgi:protein-S-isoprenylcysteine O-methyltransferase Ste14
MVLTRTRYSLAWMWAGPACAASWDRGAIEMTTTPKSRGRLKFVRAVVQTGGMIETTSRTERRLPRFGPRGEGWVGIQTAIGVAVLVTASIAGPAWSGTARVATDILGIGIALAGAGLFAWGARVLGRGFSIWLPPIPAGHFVDQGPYRHLRHPICTGQGIFLLGWALLGASPLAMVLDFAYLAYLDLFKLPSEEAHLRDRYAEYADYARRVPYKLVPHVR